MYKNFYRAPQKRRFGPRIDIARYVSKQVVSVSDVQDTKITFDEYHLDDALKSAVSSRGFVHPTPVQEKALPLILSGKDVIGIANTGTGKTGAFVLPSLQKIIKNSQERVIVIVPTRELGQQIQKEVIAFSKNSPIRTVLCIGGTSLNYQVQELRRSPQFVIGTPGRLEDLIMRKVLTMSHYHTVILDEIDRMVDMGFIDAIRRLMNGAPRERQTLCFSATASQKALVLASAFMRNPEVVSIGSQDPSANVERSIVRVEPGLTKSQTLQKLLHQDTFNKVLIFTKTKYGADDVTRTLSVAGFRAIAIHGNKSQQKRNKAIELFKYGKVSIMVATDVAARGLDIPDISHVINYDQPATYDDYIHRIGRTGRGTNKGFALTFI